MKRINFTGVIIVKGANPNGDPLQGNMPRMTIGGFGEITDVCIKRKLRNRLAQMGENIFVREADKNASSLEKRFLSDPEIEPMIKDKKADEKAIMGAACNKWFDVRMFGQVFAFKNLSIAVRGALQIMPTLSVEPISISSNQITKCVNGTESDGKGSDTMGMKHKVDYGIYVMNGQINGFIGEKNGISDEDIEKVKQALLTLFENDESTARPAGTMFYDTFVWWEQETSDTLNVPLYNANTLNNAVKVYQDVIDEERCNYKCRVEVEELPNVVPEITKFQ